MKKSDIGVGMYLLAAVIFFIIPIPSFLLDIMLAINISVALIILYWTCLFSRHCFCLQRFLGFPLMYRRRGSSLRRVILVML